MTTGVRALDVTDTAEQRAVVDAASADLGHVDVVVADAGSAAWRAPGAHARGVVRGRMTA